MANIKAWWHWLVAKSLVRELASQKEATASNALEWAAADQRADNLQIEVNDLRRKVAKLGSELRYANDARTADAAAAAQIMRERMGMDSTLSGKLDLLRKQLTQELAYVAYLEENQTEGAVAFNDLPLETRKQYFERVEGQVR